MEIKEEKEQTSLIVRLMILMGIVIGIFLIFFLSYLPFIIFTNFYGLTASLILLPIGFGIGHYVGEKMGIF